MKVFNKDKALRQIKLKQNKNTYIKRISIVLSCFILLVGVMYFTFAKFEQNSEEYTLINGKVKYGGSGDIQLSYVVDGVSQNTPPAKGTGYKIKSVECTNATGTWNKNEWGLDVRNITGKAKCNLEFEEATSVNVTLYGAPGALISYIDSTGNHTQTLDSTGKKENVEIGIMDNITFEDKTISKDPNNLSNNYTKTINVTEDTTDIYVMPDYSIYWYGWNDGFDPTITYYYYVNSSDTFIHSANSLSSGVLGYGTDAETAFSTKITKMNNFKVLYSKNDVLQSVYTINNSLSNKWVVGEDAYVGLCVARGSSGDAGRIYFYVGFDPIPNRIYWTSGYYVTLIKDTTNPTINIHAIWQED